jgi:uncharacterized cupin superfamily protein
VGKMALFRTAILTITEGIWNCQKGKWSLRFKEGERRQNLVHDNRISE